MIFSFLFMRQLIYICGEQSYNFFSDFCNPDSGGQNETDPHMDPKPKSW